MNRQKLSEQEVEQIKKFVSLLVGEDKREGISFALVSQCLDIDVNKLHELYDLLSAMKQVPPGFKWKLVQEIDE